MAWVCKVVNFLVEIILNDPEESVKSAVRFSQESAAGSSSGTTWPVLDSWLSGSRTRKE
jgi:hypothetical protein